LLKKEGILLRPGGEGEGGEVSEEGGDLASAGGDEASKEEKTLAEAWVMVVV